jgi:hypothetical protein
VSKKHRNDDDSGGDAVADAADSHANSIIHDYDDGDSIFHVVVKDSSGKSIELLSDKLLVAAGRIPIQTLLI